MKIKLLIEIILSFVALKVKKKQKKKTISIDHKLITDLKSSVVVHFF